MARIRYLKPDFFKDEDLVEHPHWIRLLFQGLWTIADKEGRLEDRPKRIKVDLFPYENTDIEKGLSELAKTKNHSSRPFIQRYELDGEKYIAIVNWHKHQKPHHTEKESLIPPPPPLNLKGMEKGMENQHEASAGLSNGYLTVKEQNMNDINTIPPRIKEVIIYCHERQNGVDPHKWFDFYQSKGWFIGKNKMKDWRAAVRTWEKDEPKTIGRVILTKQQASNLKQLEVIDYDKRSL